MASNSRNTKHSTKRGGRFCVGGGPGGQSCKNTVYERGFYTHFPDKNSDLGRYWKWVRFVRRHRPKWHPSSSLIPCSVHFEDNCFAMNKDIAKELGIRNKLKFDAVPTVDITNSVEKSSEEGSAWSTRQHEEEDYYDEACMDDTEDINMEDMDYHELETSALSNNIVCYSFIIYHMIWRFISYFPYKEEFSRIINDSSDDICYGFQVMEAQE
eukprot:gene5799-biopygen7555